MELPVTAVIAPNICISRSFDSIEAAIAKTFLRRAAKIYEKVDDSRPMYASIVVSREALLQQAEFDIFLNDITALDVPPSGFYIIVGARSSAARTDIFHADVIANWMLLNYALSIGGFDVINGYSDTLTPLLGLAGGHAGATGWWSNLRMFSMDRFLPGREGGRLPIIRYLSVLLMNRITFTEKNAFAAFVPTIVNSLRHDADYDDDTSEPQRSTEVLQSWEALNKLIGDIVLDDMSDSLEKARGVLDRAEAAYAHLKAVVAIDLKSNDEHIEAMREGIAVFSQKAEL